MYATFSFRFASGSRSFISTCQFTLSTECAAVMATIQAPMATTIFRIVRSPPFVIPDPMLDTANARIEQQSDQTDQQHSRDDEVVAFAGVAGVDDEISESGVDGDHLCGHEHDPGDAEGQ